MKQDFTYLQKQHHWEKFNFKNATWKNVPLFKLVLSRYVETKYENNETQTTVKHQLREGRLILQVLVYNFNLVPNSKQTKNREWKHETKK